MSAARPGSAWKREDLALGFVQDRRNLIPMFAEQEEITRLLITGGGRRSAASATSARATAAWRIS